MTRPRFGRQPARLLIVLSVFLALAVGAFWTYEIVAERLWFDAHPAPGLLVDIGHRRMHLLCTGSGPATVVLEAGVGDFSLAWSDIQGEVGKSIRTCSYDRGGLGWSDASPLPRDPENEAAELQLLLNRAAVPSPYILVGHSYGGDIVRVYAAHFPEHVGGIVLIEASSEDKWASIPGMLQQWQGYIRDCRKDMWRSEFALLRFHHDPLPPYYPATVRSLAEPLSYMKKAVITNCDEYGSLIGRGPAQVGAIRSLGNLPLVVISAGQNIFAEDPLIPDREQAGAIWKQTQAELTALSSQSTQVIATSSGHFVYHDQPDLVIQQILQLVSHVISKR